MTNWLIPKGADPSAASRYTFHDQHLQEFSDGLAQTPITPPPAALLLDLGAGHGAAGDAAVAHGLLASDGVRFALDHHAGFAKSACARGAIFLAPSHLATLPIPRSSVILVVASHIVRQFDSDDHLAALDLDLDEFVKFSARVLEEGSDLWIIGLEPAGTFRSADHIAGLVSAQGFACRWSGSRPDNQTPENGRQRWPKKFAVAHFPPPASLVRLVDRTVLDSLEVELEAGFGHLSFEKIDVPTFHRFAPDPNSVLSTLEYYVTQSGFEQILDELENRRSAVALANHSNFAMIGWGSWD